MASTRSNQPLNLARHVLLLARHDANLSVGVAHFGASLLLNRIFLGSLGQRHRAAAAFPTADVFFAGTFFESDGGVTAGGGHEDSALGERGCACGRAGVGAGVAAVATLYRDVLALGGGVGVGGEVEGAVGGLGGAGGAGSALYVC